MGAPARVEIEIRTADGVSLRATLCDRDATRTAILTHAMFSRRTSFDRGFTSMLDARGWRWISFDFRGHGESDKPASFGYDDLVTRDLPAVVSAVRDRFEGEVAVVGHSLGGHVALAAQGASLIDADAILGLAAPNLWLREVETWPAWIVKRAMLSSLERLMRGRDRFPARALRLGSDDEPARYMLDLVRFGRSGWRSEDGAHDYLANLAKVRVPVCAIASSADRVQASPASVERTLARCGGPTRFMCVRDVSHAAILTTTKASSAWERALDWIERELR